MEPTEILKALRKGWPISHPKRPSVTYVLGDLVRVKVDGEWEDYVLYQDPDKVKYARKLDNFKKFTLAE